MKSFALFAAALALAACGQPSPAENAAETLENAAEQSTPEAANVLENAAEQVRAGNVQDPAAIQQAMEAAGNAQAPRPAPPPRQVPARSGARPHAPGDPVPPPQVDHNSH